MHWWLPLAGVAEILVCYWIVFWRRVHRLGLIGSLCPKRQPKPKKEKKPKPSRSYWYGHSINVPRPVVSLDDLTMLQGQITALANQGRIAISAQQEAERRCRRAEDSLRAVSGELKRVREQIFDRARPSTYSPSSLVVRREMFGEGPIL